MADKNNTEYIWKDRKRTLFGLPLSFTVYKLTKEKLLIETGIFSKKQEEIRLYRVMVHFLSMEFSLCYSFRHHLLSWL